MCTETIWIPESGLVQYSNGRFVSGCWMVRYSNGGLEKPVCGPKCPLFELSAKSCDFTIWILDTWSVRQHSKVLKQSSPGGNFFFSFWWNFFFFLEKGSFGCLLRHRKSIILLKLFQIFHHQFSVGKNYIKHLFVASGLKFSKPWS